MYKIYNNDTLIYDSTLADYIIGKGQITKEVNKSGSFVFSLYNSSPFYNAIQKMKSIVRVYKGDELIFRGRPINESISFIKDKTFTCEGELSFFLDSIQRPYEFTGTPEELFRQFVENHNAQVDEDKRFTVGTVTVTDPNDYIVRSNSAYENTLTNIQKRLVDTLGGYIFITGPENARVINWYAETPYRSSQGIQFGENLLDFTKTNKTEEIATAIIPLGAEIENEDGTKTRLTIVDINDGIDYVYDAEAVATYGWIFKTETWDDVTDANNLKRKAETLLADRIKQSITIEVSSIDLSLMDRSIESFIFGSYIPIESAPHNLDDDFLLEKQSIDLLKPDNDKITLGYSFKSFSDKLVENDVKNNNLAQKIEIIEGNYVINQTLSSEIERLQSLISQTSTEINMLVSSGYVSNDTLVSELSTLYTQLKDQFEFSFTELEQTVNSNDVYTKDEFNLIQKYIRFIDGNILLGISGNELELKIEHDRISFLQDGAEVAYFSNKKLYVTDSEFLNSLTIGNFAFIPRNNGNLSFKKVR